MNSPTLTRLASLDYAHIDPADVEAECEPNKSAAPSADPSTSLRPLHRPVSINTADAVCEHQPRQTKAAPRRSGADCDYSYNVTADARFRGRSTAEVRRKLRSKISNQVQKPILAKCLTISGNGHGP